MGGGWGPVVGPTVRLTGGLFSQLRDLFQWKETDNEKQGTPTKEKKKKKKKAKIPLLQ